MMLVSLPLAIPAVAQAQAEPENARRNDDGLGEILVVAQKRSESLQDVPLSIAAISSEELERNNIATLSDLQRHTTSIGITQSTGTPQVRIRGVGGGGRSVGSTTRAGIYIDGVYFGNTAAADAVLLDLDHVEVLRGPQGFLFGQDTDAGAINFVTRPAGPDFDAMISGIGGSKSRIALNGFVNAPLSDDIFVKASFSRNYREGFITNTFTGKDVDFVDNTAGRLQARMKFDRLTIDLSADYAFQSSDLVVGEALTDAFGRVPTTNAPFTINQDTTELDKRVNYGFAASLTYSGAEFDVTSITAYRNSRRKWITDADHSPLNILIVDPYDDRFETYSEELRIATNDPDRSFRYLFGLYAYHNTNKAYRVTGLGTQGSAIGRPNNRFAVGTPKVTTKSIAGFASFDYDLLPTLTLNGGARITYEDKSLLTSGDDGGLATVFGFLTFSNVRASRSETNINPTASLSFRPNSDMLLYLRYARGTKGGGFTSDVGGPGDGFGREKVNAYEGGIKADLLDRRLRANVTVFLNNFENYQVNAYHLSETGLLTGGTVNAGYVRTYGVETEIMARPVQSLTLGVNASWLSATYRVYKNGGGIGIDYDGNQVEFAPKWTISANADFETPVSFLDDGNFLAGIHYSFRDEQTADPSNASRFFIPSYGLFDARLGFNGRFARGPSWEMSVNADNIFDKKYFGSLTQDGFGAIVGARGARRLIYARFTLRY